MEVISQNISDFDDTRRLAQQVGNMAERLANVKRAVVGTATLVGGTVAVSESRVTASSVILLTCQTPGGTPGWLQVSTRTAGTSFTILSSSGTDTSTVGWLLIEPE